MSVSPKAPKTRKGSLKETKDISVNDLPLLLRESEERIKSFFKDEIKTLTDRLSNIETNISAIKVEAVRMDNDISTMRDVIIKQQMRIESHETKFRANNLIVHNIPENDISTSADKLKSDIEKVEFICESTRIDINASAIDSSFRLGKRQGNKPRPLKIVFKEKSNKYQLLNKRKEISQNTNLLKTFGEKIFVNPDNSFLVQREEARLRQELQRIKKEDPGASLFIRSGTLYHNNMSIDKIDIAKQLF